MADSILCLHLQNITKYSILVFLTITITCNLPCLAQTNRLKILFDRLNTAKHDTDRVNAYYALSRFYWNKNSDSALLMAQKSLELAQKIKFEKGVALAYLTKGVALVSKGMLPEALDCHFKCLRISEKLKLKGLSGNEYNNIGIVYADMEDYTKALYYYKQAYKIALTQDDPTGYNTFGLLVNTGEIFKSKGQPDSAIAYTLQAVIIAKRVHDSIGIATSMYNIADNYIIEKNYKQAGIYLYAALAVAKKVNDDEDVTYCHTGLALTCYYTAKYDSSMLYAQMSLAESKKLGIVELMKSAYNVLYLTHKRAGNYEKALFYRDLEVALTDSLKTADKEKVIKNIQATYDLEKKQEQIDLLNKDNIIKQKELEGIKMRRNIQTAATIVFILLAFILLFYYSKIKVLSRQLKKQNINILEQNKHLEELVQVRNRLFSIIGHDLRGPIHSINSMMGVIGDGGQFSAEDNKFLIEKARESLTSTTVLLDNLLYWAKSQMDGIEAKPANFDVEKIIARNISLLTARAAEKKIVLVQKGTMPPLNVYADEAMVDIVTRNLMENAIKFCKVGNTVILDAEKKGNHVIVSVKDNGQGIAPEAQNKIFNKFSSYTTFGTAKEKGSGLGLLLCKELVEKNDGTIWFESKLGEGSTFYFTIPIDKKE